MSQPNTDGKSFKDPFGFWKAARDANLEAWSKLMVDMVNSDEYAKTTGAALTQFLALSQPGRDAAEQSMTQTLATLNMPSRAEVISIAERLVNVEMRLDDLDAKLSTMERSLQEAIKSTVREIEARIPTGKLENIETRLNSLDATLASLPGLIKDAVRQASQAPEGAPAKKTTPATDPETASGLAHASARAQASNGKEKEAK
jgi:hypothetical protein